MQADMNLLIRILSEIQDCLSFSPKYQKRKNRHLEKGLNLNDFDPIFRERDFPQIKKSVINNLDLRRVYN